MILNIVYTPVYTAHGWQVLPVPVQYAHSHDNKLLFLNGQHYGLIYATAEDALRYIDKAIPQPRPLSVAEVVALADGRRNANDYLKARAKEA